MNSFNPIHNATNLKTTHNLKISMNTPATQIKFWIEKIIIITYSNNWEADAHNVQHNIGDCGVFVWMFERLVIAEETALVRLTPQVEHED